jgi:hypothetical protein
MMKGLWSVKAVLPTTAPDLDYGNLQEVQDGTAAQIAYLEVIDGQTAEAGRTELSQVRDALVRPVLPASTNPFSPTR